MTTCTEPGLHASHPACGTAGTTIRVHRPPPPPPLHQHHRTQWMQACTGLGLMPQPEHTKVERYTKGGQSDTVHARWSILMAAIWPDPLSAHTSRGLEEMCDRSAPKCMHVEHASRACNEGQHRVKHRQANPPCQPHREVSGCQHHTVHTFNAHRLSSKLSHGTTR